VTQLPEIPGELAALLRSIAADFPVLLKENLVGVYLWGSLTYGAFDERCSDVDAVVVARRDLDDAGFSVLEKWFSGSAGRNPWTEKLDMRFVIDGEFLDKQSRCCGFYSGKLGRHGSDGNPIIWLNVGQCGLTLWGRDARLIAPAVSDQCLNDALLLELGYLKEDLAKNSGDRSDRSFRHNAYAVLTACRILYTARHRRIVSKERAYDWTVAAIPPERRQAVAAAWNNRLSSHGQTTSDLERDAAEFVRFAEEQAKQILVPQPTTH
jgi:predicted nucleotidyltransferase